MSLRDVQEFDVGNEDDLRFMVACYFRELGFEAKELRFESRFEIHLGHSDIIVGRDSSKRGQVTGRSDLLLFRDGRAIAVVETKAPDHPLTEDDAWQALSYARLLREMAPFAIVTNGRETQVYDTFSGTLTLLPDPTGSCWCLSGQNIPSIHDDLRYEAARMLIGLDPHTLGSFCTHQVEVAMADLRGTIYEGKKYVPDLYTCRKMIWEAFHSWLESDMACFALVGESGLGKTNFMCATAEGMTGNWFVLFYPAMRLYEGLLAAIRNDFVWEFHRERDAAYIVQRFEAIARQAGRKLIIFVDGLDESPQDLGVLKAELLDFIVRIRGTCIRLCMSCKAFDWEHFIIDKGQTYNQLAKSTYPACSDVSQPKALGSPDPKKVGFWLSEFSDEELECAFPQYSGQFSLQGSLRGSTRTECRMPLILRLVAEVYSKRGVELPDRISSREVFDRYWERRLGETRSRVAAEMILCKAATMMVESGDRQVLATDLHESISWSDAMATAYDDLIRLGVLLAIRDNQGYKWVGFSLEKMRSYTYTIQVRKWPLRDAKVTAGEIRRSLANPIGVEAVEFYLRTVDRGETNVLTQLALDDLTCFVEIVSALDLKASVTEDVPPENQQSALHNRLAQYASAYSEISRRYFPDLCEHIEPYRRGEVGVWVCDSMYQLRTRTPAHPEPLVFVSGEVAKMIWDHNLPPDLFRDLLPGGNLHLGKSDLADDNPHKYAWTRIRTQIGDLIAGRVLDESTSVGILRERIWHSLIHEPSGWMEGTPYGWRHWRSLGLESAQSVGMVGIGDLVGRTRHLLGDYGNLAGSSKCDEPARHWYTQEIGSLFRLYYWLWCLQQSGHDLGATPTEQGSMFEYLHQNDLMLAAMELQPLLPVILEAYRSLIRRNFSAIAERFALFEQTGCTMLIEVSWEGRGFGFRSDFLTLVYALLPSVTLPQNHVLYCCTDENQSLRKLAYERKALKGSGIYQGARFRRGPVNARIGDQQIDEPDATLYITRFPSGTPVLDQVYQLISDEADFLLGEGLRHWPRVDTRSTDWKRLDSWILHLINIRKLA